VGCVALFACVHGLERARDGSHSDSAATGGKEGSMPGVAFHARLARGALVCVFLLGLGSLASAQVGEQKEAADFSMSGVVKAVDPVKSTITLEGANEEGGVLEVDPKAELRNQEQAVKLGDVKVGWRVAVDGDLRAGKKVVTYLEVVETP
jgi:hypothetical protein